MRVPQRTLADEERTNAMKTLLLMRHAKSSWDDPQLSDVERPLNPRGERDAPRMGRFLVEVGLVPDQIITSGAVRARRTSEMVAEACDLCEQVTVTHDLYHADLSEWQATLGNLCSDWNCVLCVGHNPGIEEFIGILTSQYVRMPTAAIAHLTCDVPDWDQFAHSADAMLHDVWRPKELK